MGLFIQESFKLIEKRNKLKPYSKAALSTPIRDDDDDGYYTDSDRSEGYDEDNDDYDYEDYGDEEAGTETATEVSTVTPAATDTETAIAIERGTGPVTETSTEAGTRAAEESEAGTETATEVGTETAPGTEVGTEAESGSEDGSETTTGSEESGSETSESEEEDEDATGETEVGTTTVTATGTEAFSESNDDVPPIDWPGCGGYDMGWRGEQDPFEFPAVQMPQVPIEWAGVGGGGGYNMVWGDVGQAVLDFPSQVSMPIPADSEVVNCQLVGVAVPTPSYYPQSPPSNADSVEYHKCLSPETLFFIFYYMPVSLSCFLSHFVPSLLSFCCLRAPKLR